MDELNKKTPTVPSIFPKPQESATPIEPSMSLIEKVHEQAKLDIVTHDENVQKKVLDNAQKNIETELNTITNKVETDSNKASMKRNSEACAIFGYDVEKGGVEKWQLKLMVATHNVLFALYWIIANITVAPYNFIARKLNNSIKQTWLAALVAILVYLLILFTPFIIAKLSG